MRFEFIPPQTGDIVLFQIETTHGNNAARLAKDFWMHMNGQA